MLLKLNDKIIRFWTYFITCVILLQKCIIKEIWKKTDLVWSERNLEPFYTPLSIPYRRLIMEGIRKVKTLRKYRGYSVYLRGTEHKRYIFYLNFIKEISLYSQFILLYTFFRSTHKPNTNRESYCVCVPKDYHLQPTRPTNHTLKNNKPKPSKTEVEFGNRCKRTRIPVAKIHKYCVKENTD